MQSFRTFAFVTFAVTAPLTAQETKTAAALGPHISIDTVGPDGWRSRLGPTNLGNLLASEKGRAMWEPGVMPLLTQWQQLVGDEQAFAAVRERVLGYGGLVQIWIRLDEGESRPWPSIAMVLHADGKTDLNLLAADLRKLQEQLTGEWKKETIAGREVELRVNSRNSEAMTAPIANRYTVFLTFAHVDRVADALALAAATPLTWAEPPETARPLPLSPTWPALHVRVDVAALVAMAEQQEKDDAESLAMMRAFGLPSLRGATFSIGTAGPHVQFEAAQQFAKEPEGIFAALCPPNAGVSALQAMLRDDSAAWKVGRFDWRALFTTIRAVVVAWGESEEEFTKEVKADTGIDLEADLLAHASDELLLELRIDDIERVEDANWVLSVGLRDATAFGKGLATLLEHSKAVLTRAATTKVGDVEMHRYGIMFGYDVWLAIANGRVLVAGGREAEDAMTKALQKSGDQAQSLKTPAGDAFREVQKHLPPGVNGLARGDVEHFIAPGALWSGLTAMLEMFGDGDLVPPEQREVVRQLLRENNLAIMRSATGYADRTWRYRLYW